MRTWARQFNSDSGLLEWQQVDTDVNGYNDEVYVVTLEQCLKLGLGESPMYANYGIPAQQSVLTQIFPDFYSNRTVQQFRPYFANLAIQSINAEDDAGIAYPAYLITVTTNQNSVVPMVIPQ